ncbi:phosphate acetyltransferase [Catalinimonas alkaloidigena]|uniref:phosphate acetyltransferase n=1 Tax=Catalinimonas alkaloidigena TaxID=1075417 RepID=UPI002405D891|nr:phosphate acetyltransferase [Catalinimonas alkaloidigena]MDF9797569.1 phosphate acetyltransferase [Catalinimonas alkaloidigena]
MASSIYLATSEAHCGKSLVCLGIMEMVLRKTKRVGVFRPVISGKRNGRDKNIDLLIRHFNLDISYEETFSFTRKEARNLILEGQYNKLLNQVIEEYKALEKKCDFVLCEGTDFSDESSSFDFDINVDIAKNLGCPVLILGRGDMDRELEEVISPVRLTYELFADKECDILGVIINRVRSALAHELLLEIRNTIKDKELLVSVIPENIVLQSPTIREVAEHLDADVLYGEDLMEKQSYRYSVAAMQLQNYLPHITENCLVITPGDRGDIILSALQAHQSQNYPPISGILMTTKLLPEESIKRLLDGLPSLVPILSVGYNTYNTVAKLGTLTSYITPDNHTKITISKKLFEKYVDTTALQQKISSVRARGITPKMFQYNLVQKARDAKKHIVLPEGNDERILKAAEILIEQDIVKLTILGKPEEVKNQIARHGVRIDTEQVPIINPAESDYLEGFIDRYVEIRKSKGATRDNARDALVDVSYFGTMMVLEGLADGMVSGAAHTTQHTIRPAFQLIKTKPGVSIVSSVFFMALEDRVLVYGDCAINPNPNAEQLAEIAISSADTSQAFDIEPKVAMLSYSSGESGKGEEVEKVRKATKIVKDKRPDLKVEGPIQYDAAVDKEVGTKKMPDSEVAGNASVLIFPDLNTGNNTYKAVQRETGALAIGPILQGLRKPVNDLSRGCTVADIVNTVVITAIQSQKMSVPTKEKEKVK